MLPITAVIISTYGNHDITAAAVADVIREAEDYRLKVIVVDNHNVDDPNCDLLSAQGPYTPVASEVVLRPGLNLRWARGFNLAARYATQHWRDCDSFVVLDNDVRLSRGFFHGLRTTWLRTGAALVCPSLDEDWKHQRVPYRGPADSYQSVHADRKVPFAEKAGIFIPRTTYERIGDFDADFAPEYAWAIDVDYAMRVRAGGGEVRVTELSYLNHIRAATNCLLDPHYFENADFEFRTAMSSRYGAGWVHRVWSGFPLPDCYDELVAIRP